jgi:hypothetical protein
MRVYPTAHRTATSIRSIPTGAASREKFRLRMMIMTPVKEIITPRIFNLVTLSLSQR